MKAKINNTDKTEIKISSFFVGAGTCAMSLVAPTIDDRVGTGGIGGVFCSPCAASETDDD